MAGSRLETICLWVAGITSVGLMAFGQRAAQSRWIVLALIPALISVLLLLTLDIQRKWADMKALRESMPHGRFWSMIVGMLLLVLGYAWAIMWLRERIGWPERYGFTCHGRGCWLFDLRYSSRLLEVGSGEEWGLFLLIWAIPALLVVAAAYALVKRMHSRR